MKKNISLALILGGFLCGCETLPEQPPSPMVPQTLPPTANVDVNLDTRRHYDVTCHDGQNVKVYSDCRIIGFAGPELVTPQGPASTDGYFDHWLVIELPDAHRVYLPPGIIAYVEELKK